MKTDLELKDAVEEALRSEPGINAAAVGVAVDGGIVTLTGRLASHNAQQVADRAVERVPEVRAIVEEMRIRTHGKDGQADLDIAERAAENIDEDFRLPLGRIKVMVRNGWVFLDGEVESSSAREAARECVHRLKGVNGVTNRITVCQKVTPERLEEEIMEALEGHALSDARQIRVEIHGDKVTLRGNVQTTLARQEAEAAALRVPGVATVESRLTVGRGWRRLRRLFVDPDEPG